jgi:hypothetical protein
MSSRLHFLINECLDVSVEECSRILGYANSSPLRKAMSGLCFIDSEKLVTLSSIKNSEGLYANLHWLITGNGPKLLKCNECDEMEELLKKLRALPENKIKAIIQLCDL